MSLLLKSIKSGTCGKIRRLTVIGFALAVLIVSTSLISFAKDSVSPISSPLAEPVPSVVQQGDFDRVTFYYVTQWNTSYSAAPARYCLYEVIVNISHGSQYTFNCDRQNTGLFCSGSVQLPFTVNIYDISSGSLLSSNTSARFALYGVPSGWSSVGFSPSYFPENLWNSDISAGGYPIIPSGWTIQGGTGNNAFTNSEPFVTWAVRPPDQTIYHSTLSEPVCDKYNRYFIVDDRLYWVSLRNNTYYLKQSEITSHNAVFQYQTYFVSGEFVTGMDMSYSTWLPVSLNLDYWGDSLPYDLCLVPSQDQWKVSILGNDILANTNFNLYYSGDVYVSEFDLTDGSYIDSQYRHVYYQNLSFSDYILFESGSFSSVKCYGVDFLNSNCLPINLSQVIWQSDPDFMTWRDDMLLYLQRIYNLLSEGSSVEEPTTYQNFGQGIDDDVSALVGNNSPEQVAGDLNNVFSQDSVDFQSYSETVKGWISWFSIPKIITVCVLALACGTVILTLGKKKSE